MNIILEFFLPHSRANSHTNGWNFVRNYYFLFIVVLEELDDGTWYCNRCKSHQKLYRLPDILVIHFKRFNMTTRFREMKFRAKVADPIKALDMEERKR
jgi:ubiquitin C-terminal hydrolase